ncbi:MAG: ABC transporter ATP-binding protein [Hyphomicrobiales bacterium]|nr:MAG: ABC transporter ATP-binding protein [Hyphomicrobiales bacterium]
MSAPILEVRNVTVQFGALKAVDSVTLSLRAGERRALIGPNGAGKTTLFNAITGGVSVSAGRVVFAGTDMTRKSAAARAHLGIARTFQITNLFDQLDVRENMRLAVRGLSAAKFSLLGRDALGAEHEARVVHALAVSHLEDREHTLVKDLSYGEQRQLEVAMALAASPRLLLLDEPAAGLSPAERTFLADIIRGLPRDLTIVLIEHDMDLALGLVDYVTVMQNGRVIAEDAPDAIRTNPLVQEVYLGKPHTVSMAGGPDAAAH